MQKKIIRLEHCYLMACILRFAFSSLRLLICFNLFLATQHWLVPSVKITIYLILLIVHLL